MKNNNEIYNEVIKNEKKRQAEFQSFLREKELDDNARSNQEDDNLVFEQQAEAQADEIRKESVIIKKYVIQTLFDNYNHLLKVKITDKKEFIAIVDKIANKAYASDLDYCGAWLVITPAKSINDKKHKISLKEYGKIRYYYDS